MQEYVMNKGGTIERNKSAVFSSQMSRISNNEKPERNLNKKEHQNQNERVAEIIFQHEAHSYKTEQDNNELCRSQWKGAVQRTTTVPRPERTGICQADPKFDNRIPHPTPN